MMICGHQVDWHSGERRGGPGRGQEVKDTEDDAISQEMERQQRALCGWSLRLPLGEMK